MQWVPLHPQIFRNTDFAPTVLWKNDFCILFYTKVPFLSYFGGCQKICTYSFEILTGPWNNILYRTNLDFFRVVFILLPVKGIALFHFLGYKLKDEECIKMSKKSQGDHLTAYGQPTHYNFHCMQFVLGFSSMFVELGLFSFQELFSKFHRIFILYSKV